MTPQGLEPQLQAEVDGALGRAMDFARERDYAGTDPYDGLLSPYAGVLRGRVPRQVWVQGHKRLGRGLRAATRVPPVRMTKGMALFSTAASLSGDEQTARQLAQRILQERGTGPWGYEFDVQTRWAFYPAGSPNVIAVTFALRALSAAGMLDRVSADVRDWLEGQFHTSGYFRYTTTSDRLVHNGSLLAAESLAMLDGDRELIRTAVDRAVRAQAEDGSWPYGEGPGLEWIDSFHTIYNLDSLWALQQMGFESGDSAARGAQFWKDRCLSPEGLPLYMADDRQVSTDVHNVATTVGYLARAAQRGWPVPDPEAAIRHLLGLQGGDGGFRSGGRGLPHMRWNQGHAAVALASWASSGRRADWDSGGRTDDGSDAARGCA